MAGACCPSVRECSRGQPLCDSEGRTQASPCHFRVAACRAAALGRPVPLSVQYEGRCCDRDCAPVLEPQCDQHGQMYDNRCRFEEAACRSQR